ncbi:MAG: riboflavin synthase [bacterium]|nr:riboflavin synthase [bacterium]
MFTGLIETKGTVRSIRRTGSSVVLQLDVSWIDNDLPRQGDSVAVNGACLTVVKPTGQGFSADLSPETERRTTLSSLKPGAVVNLERALRLGDRIGGHLVQGHIDAIVRVLAIVPEGAFSRWRLSLPENLRREITEKGSVALHGVSLTVASLRHDSFEIALIPETLSATTLNAVRTGDQLHLETDVLAKYVARHFEGQQKSALHELFGGGNGDASG